MPGPAPLPVEILDARGSKQKYKRGKERIPVVSGMPDPPKNLDTIALTEWEYIVPILSKMKILAESDYMALAALCEAWSDFTQATTMCLKMGMARATDTRYKALYTIKMKSFDRWRRLCIEFGLTPAARARIEGSLKEGTGGESDKSERFFHST